MHRLEYLWLMTILTQSVMIGNMYITSKIFNILESCFLRLISVIIIPTIILCGTLLIQMLLHPRRTTVMIIRNYMIMCVFYFLRYVFSSVAVALDLGKSSQITCGNVTYPDATPYVIGGFGMIFIIPETLFYFNMIEQLKNHLENEKSLLEHESA